MQRTLKVSTQTREIGKYLNKSWVSTPKLILQGTWFKEAGFIIGELVQVVVTDSMIQVIKNGYKKPDKPQEQPEPLENFVQYIDNLHYEGYSDNIRREYPDQWEELFRQYKEDYPRLKKIISNS